MILQEVARKVTTEGVESALQRMYFHDGEFNKKIYAELLERMQETKAPTTDCDMTIHVEYAKDCGSEESIWTCTYSMNKRFNRKFLLVFANAEQIAGANVIDEELLNSDEYMAHVLREILYQHESDDEESDYQAEEKERRRQGELEYCSVKEVLDSMEEETYDD